MIQFDPIWRLLIFSIGLVQPPTRNHGISSHWWFGDPKTSCKKRIPSPFLAGSSPHTLGRYPKLPQGCVGEIPREYMNRECYLGWYSLMSRMWRYVGLLARVIHGQKSTLSAEYILTLRIQTPPDGRRIDGRLFPSPGHRIIDIISLLDISPSLG